LIAVVLMYYTRLFVLIVKQYHTVWYGTVEFNIPLDTVKVISETTALSSDVHLPFSNGGPAT